MSFSNLDEKFGLTILEEEEAPIIPIEPTTEIEDDAELARKTLRDLIKKGLTAVDGIANIAAGSEHPRAYEVQGLLIKTISELSKDLLEIQKRKKDLQKTTDSDKSGNVTNNGTMIFAGSTQDLIKAIRDSVNNEPSALPEGKEIVIDAEIIEETANE